MKTKQIKVLVISGLLLMILVGVGLKHQDKSFVGSRQLPLIRTDHVHSVTLEYYMGETLVLDCSDNQENLVRWFNASKEVKTEVGTTSDCRITMVLKDGGEIYIWNLYSEEWVTIGYRDKERYVQSNVYSEELAAFFIDFREALDHEARQEDGIEPFNL